MAPVAQAGEAAAATAADGSQDASQMSGLSSMDAEDNLPDTEPLFQVCSALRRQLLRASARVWGYVACHHQNARPEGKPCKCT